MDKKSLRKEIIQKRDSLDFNEKRHMDESIKKYLVTLKEFEEAKNIFIYIGFGSEINTYDYIKEFLAMGKSIYVPKTNIKEKTMEAVRIDSLNKLIKDKYGILEPDSFANKINKDEIDLVILPGVVFDKYGGRIGYGGGYYDKYLEDMSESIPKIVLCYEFQVIDKVPSELHDIKADNIITEKGFVL